jgi:hypothetical protein
MFMYIRTLNFLNQPSIIGFYSVVLETWLHWNKDTSIDNFIVNVIVWATSTFVNLNFHFFIKINYSNFIHYCFFYHAGKEKKTYMLWLGFNKAKYFTVYTSCSGKTPLYESPSHSMSLRWERLLVSKVPCHGLHLAAHALWKQC